MQEKTIAEERALVHGMFWNCQESGQQRQPPGTGPKERETDAPQVCLRPLSTQPSGCTRG